MAGVGIALAWFGYWVGYYGLNLVTGGNESFMSLGWPGAYSPAPRDSQGGTPQTGKAKKQQGSLWCYLPFYGQILCSGAVQKP